MLLLLLQHTSFSLYIKTPPYIAYYAQCVKFVFAFSPQYGIINIIMKIFIISDTHKQINRAISAIEEEKPDFILHLGDMVSDAEDIAAIFPGINVRFVSGNNDFEPYVPNELLITIDGARMFLTHGHSYGVKQGTSRLAARGHAVGASFVFFGHTHIPYDRSVGNVRLMNPSSNGYIIIENGFAEVRGY